MKTTLIIELFIPLILCVASSLMGYIIWILQQQRKETREARDLTSRELAAIKHGVMLELRRDIIEEHNRYVNDQKPMLPLAYDNLCEVYDTYKALDGNGMAKKLMEEIETVHIEKGGIQ